MRFCLVLFLSFLLAGAEKRAAPPPSGDIEARKGELEEIKREIEQNRQEIEKLEDKEADLATRLQKIEDNITMVGTYIRKLNDQEKALEKDMDSIKTNLGRTTTSLAKRKAMLRKRIRRIYIQGRYDPLDVVFSAQSFSDFIRRYTFFKYLADNDQQLISSVFNEQRSIERSKKTLEDRIADIQAVMAEKSSEQKKLSDQRKTREKILQQVKGRKDTYLKLAEDLEKRKEEINKIIEALEEARRKSLETTRRDRLADFGDFGKLKGRLPWPVQGKVIRKFGKNMHPVYHTITINNGIDVEVQPGVAIQAVASGEVLYTGSMSSFGNFVIIGHSSGFYTLYANLSFIGVKKGDKVEAGGSLGLSGDTGSLEGAKLHFEIRQQRQIFNPSDWLAKRKG
jgi:septal ring factor EnvC (AmiA/AmiB activator)